MRKLSACLMAALLSATPALADPVASPPAMRPGATVGEVITTVADHVSKLANRLAATTSLNDEQRASATDSAPSSSEARALIQRMFPWLKMKDTTETATSRTPSSPSG